MKSIVLEKNANLFKLEDGKYYPVRKNLNLDGVYVGDYVEANKDIIESVYERKNLLIRPPIANLDKLFIVVAEIPKPDLLLVDKIIIYCLINDIIPHIVINKSDSASEQFIANITRIYKNVANVLITSAKYGKIESVKKEIYGVCAMAGQSAVGKSSLINAIFNEHVKVGDLAKKVERGKQTTRLVTLYVCENGYLADTAGFSMLDVKFMKLTARDLRELYSDFKQYDNLCKFNNCSHSHEQECAVKLAVERGEISRIRYNNYLNILNALKNKNF